MTQSESEKTDIVERLDREIAIGQELGFHMSEMIDARDEITRLRTERWAEAIEAAANLVSGFYRMDGDPASWMPHIAARIRALPVPPLNKERE